MKKLIIIASLFALGCGKNGILPKKKHTIEFSSSGYGNNITWSNGSTSSSTVNSNSTAWVYSEQVEEGKTVSLQASNNKPILSINVKISQDGKQVSYEAGYTYLSRSYTVK